MFGYVDRCDAWLTAFTPWQHCSSDVAYLTKFNSTVTLTWIERRSASYVFTTEHAFFRAYRHQYAETTLTFILIFFPLKYSSCHLVSVWNNCIILLDTVSLHNHSPCCFAVDFFRWCLMSSDVGWHIRDKLRPMQEHGSILLYVHGNREAR